MLFDKHGTSMLDKPWNRPLLFGSPPSLLCLLPLFLHSPSLSLSLCSFLVSHPSSSSLSSPSHPRSCLLVAQANSRPSPTHPSSAHFSSISMWRLFISEVPSWPNNPHHTYSLCHSLNGCSIKERGGGGEGWNHPSFLLHAPPLWLSQKWYVPQQELQKSREHIVCNLALQRSLPDSCVRSLSRAPIPSFAPPHCVSVRGPSSLGLLDKRCSSPFV